MFLYVSDHIHTCLLEHIFCSSELVFLTTKHVLVQLFVRMFVCDKGRPLLLVINEYTKVLNIMVKITETKTIYLPHAMWAVWVNGSGKSENITCFKTQTVFKKLFRKIQTHSFYSRFPIPVKLGVHIIFTKIKFLHYHVSHC
jgi:hypothetical protein